MNTPLKRSDEPVWWALFSAGGVCFAVVIPGLILSLAILYPLGLIDAGMLSYQRVHQLMFGNLWGLGGIAIAGAAICLPLFHAAHRIHHGLHDLKLAHSMVPKIVCYGLAAVFSLLALYWVAISLF
ncbi:fumarate reductase subunit D [Chromatiaceae bacterium AAb-1]|nr:fumarate reductase subunit D [Chromatiaceae bacterium AAb-1]